MFTWSVSCSVMCDFVTPWTVAHQAPLSTEFSRQEYWSGLPCPFSRGSLWPRDQTWVSYIAGGFFTIWPKALVFTFSRLGVVKTFSMYPSQITALLWWRGLCNSMKLWAMPCRATQDRWVIAESSDKMWSARGKPPSILAMRTSWTTKRVKRYNTERWVPQVLGRVEENHQ